MTKLRQISPMLRRSALAVLALGLVAVLAACSMPSNDGPQPISLGEDNAELLEPAPSTSSTSTTARGNTREIGVYFIVDDLLQRVSDDLPISQDGNLNLTLGLEKLLDGTPRENHRSAIPAGVEVLGTRVDDDSDVATIVLADAALFSIEGPDLRRAIAQFVFTATDRNGAAFGVDAIRFEIDGDIRSIPTGDGSNTSDPVDRCDYEGFAGSIDQIRGCPAATTTTATPTTTSSRPPATPAS